MNYSIILDKTFAREVKRLNKKYPSFKKDLLVLQDELLANPLAGADLGNGIRKVRMAIASKGRGKSHGARVITVTIVVAVEETEINLLHIYDKSERESISSHEIELLLKENNIQL